MEEKKTKTAREIHHGNQFKTILKYSPWYLVSTILTKMSVIFLVPIYTKYLSPEDYGVLNTLTAFGGALPVFISLAIDSSFMRFYFLEKKVSHENVRTLYSTLFWFIVAWGSVMTTVSLLGAPLIFKSLVDIPYWPFMPLTIVPMLLSQLTDLGSGYLRANLKTRTFTIIKIARFVVSTSVVVILLVYFRLGIKANLYGAFCGSFLGLGLYIYLSLRYALLGFYFDWKILKRCLYYSIPFVPIIASSWIAGLSDRLILAYYGRVREVGLYSISANVARMLYFANDAITQVQGPISLSALTEDRELGKKQVCEFLMVFMWGLTIAYLLLTFFSKEILYLIANERYHSAYKLVGILGFTFVLGGIYRPFSMIISFHAKTWLFAAAAFIQAGINAALNFAFIPLFGQYAAAWSTLVSVLSYSVWVIWWAQRLDPIPIRRMDILSVIFFLSIALGVFIFIERADYFSFWEKFLLKLGIIGMYSGASITNGEFRKFLISGVMLVKGKGLLSKLFPRRVMGQT
jgi:O-antigen/teichoic acid export membrane protein